MLAGAAALRLLHWAAVGRLPFVDQLVLDSAEYDRWARTLAAGDWLGSEPFFQAPLYPYLIGLVYRLAATPHAVYLLQIAAAVAGLSALLADWAASFEGPRPATLPGIEAARSCARVIETVERVASSPSP